MTKEEAERALDECYRELQSLLNRYGASIENDWGPEWEGLWLRLYDSMSQFQPVLAEVRLDD